MNLKSRLIFSGMLACCTLITNAQKDSIPDTKYFPPTGKPKNVAILLLGGSEGGLPAYYNVEKFTSMGFPCFMAGYFGTKNTPDRLEKIPLEILENAVNTFKSLPEVSGKKIVVYGGSKGGELALLLASINKDIQGVIAAVPSSVVFQGIGGRLLSSWTYRDKQFPFVPYAPYDFSKIKNSEYVELYRLSLAQNDYVSNATIPVENINGPVLILTGNADSMWPSAQMGQMIADRLKEKKFSHWFKHISYDDAGHSLNENYIMGGTIEGNRNARLKDMIQELVLITGE